MKLSKGHQRNHYCCVMSEGCPEIDVQRRPESGCHRDQREEAEQLLRLVSLRTRKLGRQRIGWI